MGLRLYSDSHPAQRTKQCVLRGLGGARLYLFYNLLQRSLTATISMSIYLTHVHAKQIIKSVTYTQSRFVDSMGKLKRLTARLGSIILRSNNVGEIASFVTQPIIPFPPQGPRGRKEIYFPPGPRFLCNFKSRDLASPTNIIFHPRSRQQRLRIPYTPDIVHGES